MVAVDYDDHNLWGNLTARNEIYQVDGEWYRLSTNLDSQLIARPEKVHWVVCQWRCFAPQQVARKN